MAGGHHVLELVASRRHETLGFVLSVRTLEVPPSSTQYACVFLSQESGQDFQVFLDAQSRPPGNSESLQSVRRGPPRTTSTN